MRNYFLGAKATKIIRIMMVTIKTAPDLSFSFMMPL